MASPNVTNRSSNIHDLMAFPTNLSLVLTIFLFQISFFSPCFSESQFSHIAKWGVQFVSFNSILSRITEQKPRFFPERFHKLGVTIEFITKNKGVVRFAHISLAPKLEKECIDNFCCSFYYIEQTLVKTITWYCIIT